MSELQCYIASALCIAFALTFTYALSQITQPLIAVTFGSVLVAIGSIFFLIGINKWNYYLYLLEILVSQGFRQNLYTERYRQTT